MFLASQAMAEHGTGMARFHRALWFKYSTASFSHEKERVTISVSQYQLRKVQTCILGSLNLASSTRECELLRMGGLKSSKGESHFSVLPLPLTPSP